MMRLMVLVVLPVMGMMLVVNNQTIGDCGHAHGRSARGRRRGLLPHYGQRWTRDGLRGSSTEHAGDCARAQDEEDDQ